MTLLFLLGGLLYGCALGYLFGTVRHRRRNGRVHLPVSFCTASGRRAESCIDSWNCDRYNGLYRTQDDYLREVATFRSESRYVWTPCVPDDVTSVCESRWWPVV